MFIVVSKSDWMIVNVTDDHFDFFITFDTTAVAFGSASTLNLVVSSAFALCFFQPLMSVMSLLLLLLMLL